jgi:predicted metal-binding protein
MEKESSIMNPNEAVETTYLVVVQCERRVNTVCAGYQCEWAFWARRDAFAEYPPEGVRYLSMSCGGCPGRALTRKLVNLKSGLKKRENRGTEGVRVHLSTCITRSSHHGPACPHLALLKQQIDLAGLPWVEDSRISPTAERRRAEGLYGGTKENLPENCE